ncbi:MAG TPA: hypothetical protein VGW77_08625 [Candidatus Binatia bacterium]|jgi:hypothetical protein|nr:hypothetical protein [Candidatus Binatia bacterium]
MMTTNHARREEEIQACDRNGEKVSLSPLTTAQDEKMASLPERYDRQIQTDHFNGKLAGGFRLEALSTRLLKGDREAPFFARSL